MVYEEAVVLTRPLADVLDVLPQIGLLLPCNVVVREVGGANGDVMVEAMDPGLMANISGNDSVGEQ